MISRLQPEWLGSDPSEHFARPSWDPRRSHGNRGLRRLCCGGWPARFLEVFGAKDLEITKETRHGFCVVLVGGWPTPLKQSQLGWLFPIYGKIEVMFQTTNQSLIWWGRDVRGFLFGIRTKTIIWDGSRPIEQHWSTIFEGWNPLQAISVFRSHENFGHFCIAAAQLLTCQWPQVLTKRVNNGPVELALEVFEWGTA